MQADNAKLIFTYVIAIIVVAGGGAMLYLIRLDPADSGSGQLALALTGFMGLALGFVFNREAATSATRAAQNSTAQGYAAGANGGSTTTVSAGPPVTVTTTPTDPVAPPAPADT